MSSHEYAEWMAFAKMHPFGDARADLRMAILAAQITNVWTRSKDSDPIAKPEDFMPSFEDVVPEDEEPAMSEEDAIAAIDAMFTAYAIASGGMKMPEGSEQKAVTLNPHPNPLPSQGEGAEIE